MRRATLSLLLLLSVIACGVLENPKNKNNPELPGKIVFSAHDEDGTSQIYTMNADGTGVTQLTYFDPDGGATQPAWSPNGTQIAFANYTGATTLGPYLYIMNADGSNMRPLKRRETESIEALIGSAPAWSPDGTHIAFEVCTNCELGGEDYEISVVEVAGETFDKSQIRALSDHPASDMFPIWSPDGERIAFTSDRDYLDADTLRFRQDLYVVNADGSNQQRVTESGFPGGYVWMNNNELIQTVTDRNTNMKDILVLNIETGQTTPLMENLDVKNQLWVLWDPVRQQLLTINKNHEELPIVIATYDLHGKQLHLIRLNTEKMRSARGFDWFIPKIN